VKKRDKIGFDIEIDELTNSIKNVISGDSFSTDIARITKADLKNISQKEGWQFDWKLELKQPERDVFKLTIVNNQSIIQGLISLEVRSDHVYMHLVESAPFNKGKSFIQGSPEILLLLHVNFLSREDMREMLHLFPNHN
jgi:hypothetical protein